MNHQRGVSFIEILVVLALLSILGMAAYPVGELERRKQQEDDLRFALREMRTAIDAYRRDFGTGPATFHELLTTEKAGGGFYLRSFPMNPFTANPQWEATSLDRGDPSDPWVVVTATGTALPDGETLLAVRTPDPATYSGGRPVTLGKALNGTSYKDW